MTVTESIELMKREGSRLARPVPVPGMADMSFRCLFAEEGATPAEIVEFASGCPTDLIDFWRNARNAKLFQDQSYGQWGLEILDPQHAFSMTRQCRERRSRDFTVGDLVIGKFLGDSDLLVIRCDSTSDDFGSVLVALPIDVRKDWYCVSPSFADFLELFIKARGDKVWANS